MLWTADSRAFWSIHLTLKWSPFSLAIFHISRQSYQSARSRKITASGRHSESSTSDDLAGLDYCKCATLCDLRLVRLKVCHKGAYENVFHCIEEMFGPRDIMHVRAAGAGDYIPCRCTPKFEALVRSGLWRWVVMYQRGAGHDFLLRERWNGTPFIPCRRPYSDSVSESVPDKLYGRPLIAQLWPSHILVFMVGT